MWDMGKGGHEIVAREILAPVKGLVGEMFRGVSDVPSSALHLAEIISLEARVAEVQMRLQTAREIMVAGAGVSSGTNREGI